MLREVRGVSFLVDRSDRFLPTAPNGAPAGLGVQWKQRMSPPDETKHKIEKRKTHFSFFDFVFRLLTLGRQALQNCLM